MRKIQNVFLSRPFINPQISSYIRREFLQESLRKNDFSLRIICVIIFVVELFNISRVLIWSQAGLGTRNNRIYFTMYCILILVAVLWLILRRPMRRTPVRYQWIVQYAVTCLIFLWHLGLNTYDLYRDPGAGTTVLTTALLGLALLIQAPPQYSIGLFAAGYVLFRIVMAPLLDAGDQLNLTITFVVALAVSLAHSHHAAIALMQQRQIVEINAKLQELVQQDPLTGLLNKTTMECRAEQLLGGSERGESAGGLTLFLLDLDEFKGINDRYGHPCGDHVLEETAEAMREVFPDAAALGRVGGDEFAILYDRALTETRAMALGTDLIEGLGKIQWQNQPLEVRCSVGVSICPRGQCTYRQLYAETDRMLYRAKEDGRGRCCVGQPEHGENRALEEAEL